MMPRSNPFEDVEQFFERMSRQFEDMGRFDYAGIGAHAVDVDVADEGDAYVVTADLPGFEREDIEVSLADYTLTISAEQEHEAETDAGSYLRRERHSESVRRSVRLPEAVDEDDTSAAYRNGVLTVTLPRLGDADDDESHRIDID